MTWNSALGLSTDGVEERPPQWLNAPPEPERHRRARRVHKEDTLKRRDIQGLRAVAVVSVVVNHLVSHPQGGFVGVDVFFVISGYLITSLLLREDDKTGTISLTGFYRRRIRRLFPAALTVTLATIVAAYFAFLSERFHTVVVDGVWATLFGANWRFLAVGTDYFQALGPTSPMQHYWSLSVEEQFYVVWPLFLLIVLKVSQLIFAGRRNAILAAGALAAATLTVPSLVYAAMVSNSQPITAYFSTFSRAWELGLGAILAVLAPYMRGGRVVLTALSWLGTILIGISFFTVNQSHFPFPGGLLPTIGSALVLTAFTTQAQAANPLLTNPLSNYLGDISYSVYVVHFPVIVIAASLTVDRPVVYYVAIALGILALSMVLYHSIENPIRQSNWLLPKSKRVSRRDRGSLLSGRPIVIGTSFAVIALALWTLAAPNDVARNNQLAQDIANALKDPPDVGQGVSPSPGATAPPQQALPPKLAEVQATLVAAAETSSWPKINPPFGEHAPEENNGCPQDNGAKLLPLSDCTWGDPAAKHTMYLVGDSTSAAYINTFDSDAFLGGLKQWKVVARNTHACPFSNSGITEDPNNKHSTGCADRNEAIKQEILHQKPDMVVETSTRGDAERIKYIQPQLAAIKNAVKQIVVLPAPPKIKDPNVCFTAGTPLDCITKLSKTYESWMVNERKMAEVVGAKFFDPRLLYCAGGQFCPVFVKTIPLTKDGSHITPDYARFIAPAMLEMFTRAHLLP